MFCDISQSYSKMRRKPFSDLERHSQFLRRRKLWRPWLELRTCRVAPRSYVSVRQMCSRHCQVTTIPSECASILKDAGTWLTNRMSKFGMTVRLHIHVTRCHSQDFIVFQSHYSLIIPNFNTITLPTSSVYKYNASVKNSLHKIKILFYKYPTFFRQN